MMMMIIKGSTMDSYSFIILEYAITSFFQHNTSDQKIPTVRSTTDRVNNSNHHNTDNCWPTAKSSGGPTQPLFHPRPSGDQRSSSRTASAAVRRVAIGPPAGPYTVLFVKRLSGASGAYEVRDGSIRSSKPTFPVRFPDKKKETKQNNPPGKRNQSLLAPFAPFLTPSPPQPR